MPPKITSDLLHAVHQELILDDERRRRLNRAYCLAMDSTGWHAAWETWTNHERTKPKEDASGPTHAQGL